MKSCCSGPRRRSRSASRLCRAFSVKPLLKNDQFYVVGASIHLEANRVGSQGDWPDEMRRRDR